MYFDYITNLMITALFIAIWAYLATDLVILKRWKRQLALGAFMAAASVASMLHAVELPGGNILDLRIVPIAAAAYVGGPIAAFVAAAIACGTRIALGGDGAAAGVMVILLAALSGLAASRFLAPLAPRSRLLVTAAIVSTVPHLPGLMAGVPIEDLVLLAVLEFPSVVLAIWAIKTSKRRAAERALLHAAIRSAPDYLYVKDRASRLVDFSQSVIDVSGVTSERALRGMTDMDITGDDHGWTLLEAEQQLMATNTRCDDQVEPVRQPDGTIKWFKSAKAPVQDADGEVVGLVGITLDVTADVHELVKSDNRARQMVAIFANMANGVAVFDNELRLVFCNEQYHEMFPLTRDVRVEGVPLAQILKVAVARGEQAPHVADIATWIAEVSACIRNCGEEEVRLSDGRISIIRNREVAGLGYVSVVTDVTQMRRAEDRLAKVTKQLRRLAGTDALTGLANRRSLDEMLQIEIERANRTAPLSVVMIDFDHFKAFNDAYGHPSGDRCLQAISSVLRKCCRPSDQLARYGGEEFCVVLPATDPEKAFEIAEAMRTRVLQHGEPHVGSSEGVMTISLGIATCADPDAGADSLLAQADQALYLAKSRGRNVTQLWNDSIGAERQKIA